MGKVKTKTTYVLKNKKGEVIDTVRARDILPAIYSFEDRLKKQGKDVNGHECGFGLSQDEALVRAEIFLMDNTTYTVHWKRDRKEARS
jgi:hypothetical protein